MAGRIPACVSTSLAFVDDLIIVLHDAAIGITAELGDRADTLPDAFRNSSEQGRFGKAHVHRHTDVIGRQWLFGNQQDTGDVLLLAHPVGETGAWLAFDIQCHVAYPGAKWLVRVDYSHVGLLLGLDAVDDIHMHQGLDQHIYLSSADARHDPFALVDVDAVRTGERPSHQTVAGAVDVIAGHARLKRSDA